MSLDKSIPTPLVFPRISILSLSLNLAITVYTNLTKTLHIARSKTQTGGKGQQQIWWRRVLEPLHLRFSLPQAHDRSNRNSALVLWAALPRGIRNSYDAFNNHMDGPNTLCQYPHTSLIQKGIVLLVKISLRTLLRGVLLFSAVITRSLPHLKYPMSHCRKLLWVAVRPRIEPSNICINR